MALNPRLRRMAAIPLLLAAAGCARIHPDVDVVRMVGNVFGAHLEGREPPPGLDQPWPNLASVPERPVPPDPATRASISGALAQDRERARTPLVPSGAAMRAPEGGPPAPPRLAAAPAVRLDRAGVPLPGGAAAEPTVTQPVPTPLAPPAAPPAGLLAPPPPPTPDLLAPRR